MNFAAIQLAKGEVSGMLYACPIFRIREKRFAGVSVDESTPKTAYNSTTQ